MKRSLPALLIALAPLPAFAQAAESADLNGALLLSTVLYGIIGIAMCVLGYFAFDKIAGLDLKRELVEDENLALGVMLAGVFIGIAIVVAAVMRS